MQTIEATAPVHGTLKLAVKRQALQETVEPVAPVDEGREGREIGRRLRVSASQWSPRGR